MDTHKQLDLEYHARIAPVYDYITNEPRAYPNELLFRPIDRLIRPCELMLDLGCGTGQMIFRYRNLAGRIVAVDHSPEMIREAKRKARESGIDDITFIEQDLDAFLKLNGNLKADLITCVGVLHHLDFEAGELLGTLDTIGGLLAPRGQLVLAEPVYAGSVPRVIADRNAKSILVSRLRECMPPDIEDPDEEPLQEANLLHAVAQAGFRVRMRSRGFELFHITDPISPLEKFIIRLIYWRYRHCGDVIALLLEKSAAHGDGPAVGRGRGA